MQLDWLSFDFEKQNSWVERKLDFLIINETRVRNLNFFQNINHFAFSHFNGPIQSNQLSKQWKTIFFLLFRFLSRLNALVTEHTSHLLFLCNYLFSFKQTFISSILLSSAIFNTFESSLNFYFYFSLRTQSHQFISLHGILETILLHCWTRQKLSKTQKWKKKNNENQNNQKQKYFFLWCILFIQATSFFTLDAINVFLLGMRVRLWVKRAWETSSFWANELVAAFQKWRFFETHKGETNEANP